MWDMNPRKVLVGVEHAGSRSALEYAVREAVRRGCGVHLVHVARPAVVAACAVDDVVMVEDELRLVGQAVLADAQSWAEHAVHERAPDDDRISVSVELTHGSVVASLAGLSKHACLVVLEHEGMGTAGDTATLSVTAGVATASTCPVVAVPDAWGSDRGPFGVVGVGIDLSHPATPLIEAALHEAVRRDAHLRVVHAYLPNETPAAAGHEQVEEALRRRIVDLVAGIRTPAWTVPVEAVVRAGPASAVLADQSATCDLMVAGRHHRKHIIGAPMGRTCRELLRRSTAPVLIVDPIHGDVLPPVPRPDLPATTTV